MMNGILLLQIGYRSSYDAIHFCECWNLPIEIAFDHDLGGEDTSINYLRWLINHLLDEDKLLDKDFTYSIHSQNPIGAKNIKNLMEDILSRFQDNNN